MKKLYLLVFCLIFIFVPNAPAEEINFNLVHLYGNAEKQIENDVLIVTMIAASEANSATAASDNVNRDMEWAIDKEKKAPSIVSRTLNYQTRPRYNKKTIIGWHASQQLRLESSKIAELSNLVGTLQEKLRVNSMRFSISPERKEKALNKLTVKALETFREKALLVVKTIGAKDYRLVNINIGKNSPHVPYERGFQAEAVGFAKAPSGPQVQAGESKINIRVDGTIQLVF